MEIQLGLGHLSVIFISHCGWCSNHRNISTQRYNGFDHCRPLIRKLSKQMRCSVKVSCPNRLARFSASSFEGHICHVLHQFGGSCCTSSESFSIINFSGFFCFSASNCSFCLLAWRHRGKVISRHGSHNNELNIRHHFHFPILFRVFFSCQIF